MQLALDEENKQKIVINKELEWIRIELEQSNEEKLKYQVRINHLIEENNRFRDFSGKYGSELESVTSKAIALEVCMTISCSVLNNFLISFQKMCVNINQLRKAMGVGKNRSKVIFNNLMMQMQNLRLDKLFCFRVLLLFHDELNLLIWYSYYSTAT